MTHTDLPASPESRSVSSSAPSNRYLSTADYPPKPRNWAKQLGSGAGECVKCGAWWTGSNTCHCMGCCRTFTSQTASDKHRVGSHAYDTRHCLDPATVLDKRGERVLIDAARDYPCWGFPGSDVKWWDDGSAA